MVHVSEDDEFAPVCMGLSAQTTTQKSFSVTLPTNDGSGKLMHAMYECLLYSFIFSALASVDYISSSTTVIFPSGSTSGDTKCVNITLIEDDALEGNLSFTVSLTTSDPDVMILISTATIHITDNDG